MRGRRTLAGGVGDVSCRGTAGERRRSGTHRSRRKIVAVRRFRVRSEAGLVLSGAGRGGGAGSAEGWVGRGVRPRLRAERGAAGADPHGDLQLVRLRGGEHCLVLRGWGY